MNAIESIVNNVNVTKSQKIRDLAAGGMSRADIAKTLNIRYQHVRNVLTQPLKKEVKTAIAIEDTTESNGIELNGLE